MLQNPFSKGNKENDSFFSLVIDFFNSLGLEFVAQLSAKYARNFCARKHV
jgi:hypothetical protein